jgi:hypothetical protein
MQTLFSKKMRLRQLPQAKARKDLLSVPGSARPGQPTRATSTLTLIVDFLACVKMTPLSGGTSE